MNQEKKPEALLLAEEFKLCNEQNCLPSMNDIDSASVELRRLHALSESLRAELVAEAARTAEWKLRADQMTEQHRMQCNMRQESEDVLDAAKDHIRDLEAQLSAIGAGGVESLRKRDGLQQSENAATDRDTHFYLAGWNGARGNEDSHKHFRQALQAAPAPKD